MKIPFLQNYTLYLLRLSVKKANRIASPSARSKKDNNNPIYSTIFLTFSPLYRGISKLSVFIQLKT